MINDEKIIETLCDRCELQDKDCHVDCTHEFVEKKEHTYEYVDHPSH